MGYAPNPGLTHRAGLSQPSRASRNRYDPDTPASGFVGVERSGLIFLEMVIESLQRDAKNFRRFCLVTTGKLERL